MKEGNLPDPNLDFFSPYWFLTSIFFFFFKPKNLKRPLILQIADPKVLVHTKAKVINLVTQQAFALELYTAPYCTAQSARLVYSTVPQSHLY